LKSEGGQSRLPLAVGITATAALGIVTVLAITGALLSQVDEISGERGGTLRVLAINQIGDLDPARLETAFDASLLHATLRTPYAFQPERGIVSDLALGPAEISEDSTRLELTLRPDVRFGPPVDREVTADDFAYAIERSFLPSVDSPYARYYFRSIEGVGRFRRGKADTISGLQTPDDETLVMSLEAPVARTIAQALTLPMTAPVPREYAARFDAKVTSDYARHQVATGPYRFEPGADGLIPGLRSRRIALVRNPSWDPETDFRPAFLDRIAVVPAPDQDVATERLLVARDAVSGDFSASPHDLRRALEETPDQVHLTDAGIIRFVSLNTTSPPLDDVDVRRAVTAAFDQQAARRALGGRVVGEIPTHWIPPGVPGFQEAGGAAGTGVDFLSYPSGNLGVAREYMRAAGYPSGRYEGDASLVAVGGDNSFSHDIKAPVRRAFRVLGIPIDIRIVSDERADDICTTLATTPDLCLDGGWVKDFDDAVSILPPVFSAAAIRERNNVNYSLLDDEPVDQAMEEASVTTGAADRAEKWADADRLLTAVAPAIPVAWFRYPLIRAADVKGIVDNELGRWDLTFTSLR